MPGWAVIPSIRSSDLAAMVEFYTAKLGFTVGRGTLEEGNIAISRGDARLMLESVAAGFYGAAYNDAIRARTGTPSSTALYIEAADLDELYAGLVASGVPILDPLGPRDWGQDEFTVADPDGNWLTFWRALAETA